MFLTLPLCDKSLTTLQSVLFQVYLSTNICFRVLSPRKNKDMHDINEPLEKNGVLIDSLLVSRRRDEGRYQSNHAHSFSKIQSLQKPDFIVTYIYEVLQSIVDLAPA